MSTASINAIASATKAPAGAIFRRFLWKELRMLRGFWLAVLVLGAIIQWAIGALSPPSADHAALLFSAALAAATLYAVGASATIFSVEHEDETFDFLACLPATWRPIFLGNVSVLFASAIALAYCLIAIGWLIAGSELPGVAKIAVAIGLFGVAILEAIAWGTLFSLLIKRPLLAAIVTLVVGAAAVNLLVYVSAHSTANLDATAYSTATPLRLAFVALVLALSAAVARRWLSAGALPGGSVRVRAWGWLRRPVTRTASQLRSSEARRQVQRGSMLARLIWQSWHDAGKLLLLPFAIAALLALGIAAAIALAELRDERYAAAWLTPSLFVPALYGAMTFSADQRRGSHRFLAEHAARPRYVWLARHVVWLGTLLVLSTAIFLVVASLTALGVQFVARLFLDELVQAGRELHFGNDLPTSLTHFVQGAGLAWLGILTAYSLGQFCSMLLRSEILAAFIALVLSVVITAWAVVLFAWQLSGWMFLFPLAAALMLATWLRAGDWLAGRNTWQSWLKLALPVIAILVFIAVALPQMRLLQLAVPAKSTGQRVPQYIDLEPLIAWHREGDTPQARETAAMYVRATESLDSPSAMKLAMEAAARATCRFDFNIAQFPDPQIDHPVYGKLDVLLYTLYQAELDAPFDRLLAALRMSAHMRSGQPSVVFLYQLEKEKAILQQIRTWAAHERRTNEELRSALDQLAVHFREAPSLTATLIADHLIVRDVILDQEPSLILSQRSSSLLVHLAWLANQLPWERERALMALEKITLHNLGDADELMSGFHPTEVNTKLRKWIRPRYLPPLDPMWMIAQPAAATSYFARLEYQARTEPHDLYRAYFDNRVYREATRLQLALVMFRRDQGAYPERRSELVPEYLETLPSDPYSGEQFHYEAAGLDLPLRPWGGSNFTPIESNTPLFWSVGAGDARLMHVEHRTLEADENDPDGPLREVQETTYWLVGADEWLGEPSFAFSLPK